MKAFGEFMRHREHQIPDNYKTSIKSNIYSADGE